MISETLSDMISDTISYHICVTGAGQNSASTWLFPGWAMPLLLWRTRSHVTYSPPISDWVITNNGNILRTLICCIDLFSFSKTTSITIKVRAYRAAMACPVLASCWLTQPPQTQDLPRTRKKDSLGPAMLPQPGLLQQ